jgi:hypothetical protein
MLSTSLPIDQPVEALLTFTDGDYEDFQLISFAIPSYIDVNENNIITSITSSGRIGYGNTEQQTNGSGFIYDEERLLYEMGLIMGSSSVNIFNNVRGINNTYDQVLQRQSKLIKQTRSEVILEIEGSVMNAAQIEQCVCDHRLSKPWYGRMTLQEFRHTGIQSEECNQCSNSKFLFWHFCGLGHCLERSRRQGRMG